MKYKVGDICRVRDGRKNSCGNFNDRGRVAAFIKITQSESPGYDYEILDKHQKRIGICNCFEDGDLLLKPVKVVPIQYVVVYDEEDGDPAETFTSEKELIAWLKEAMSDSNIVWDSIEVYPTTGKLKLETTFKLREIKIKTKKKE